MATYYAADYVSGKGVLSDSTRRQIRNVLQFATRAERDAWVEARLSDYVNSNGYREALPAHRVTPRERETIQWLSDSSGIPVIEAPTRAN